MTRLGNNLQNISFEMFHYYATMQVYSFLHVPVQSGSDPVLLDMKREYTVEHFCRVVDTLRFMDFLLKNK